MFAKNSIRAMCVATALSLTAGVAQAQSIQIGPGGVQILPPGYQDDNRGRDRRDRDRYSGISQRDAVRIAQRNGVREVQGVDSTRRSFEVSGLDRRSRYILVVVDKRNGEVLDVDRGRR